MDSKLPGMGESIFTTMTALSNKHKAINLSQGFPDFNCAPELIELVTKYMRMGMNQYAPMQGTIQLRDAVAEKILAHYKCAISPAEEVNITAGGTQAIFTAIGAFVHPGDEVIILEPAYDSYIPAVEVNGGIPITVQADEKTGRYNLEELQQKINKRTKAVILNTPQNPGGIVWSAEEITSLVEICREQDVFIVSDEVYEHITFDKRPHISLLQYRDSYKNIIVISSFGKTYHTTGWKIGYVIAHSDIMKEFRKIHQFTVFTVNTPIQLAYAEFIKQDKSYLELGKFYQKKRDNFLDKIKHSRFSAIPAEGTYFQILDYSNISELPDTEFTVKLTEEFKVAAIPLSPFYRWGTKQKKIRICFAKSDEVLEEGIERLLKADEEL